MPERIRAEFNDFKQLFDVSKPWFRQLQKFCAERDFPQIREKKVELAELLPTNVKEQPPTYVALAPVIKNA
jgi:hypothetical protein